MFLLSLLTGAALMAGLVAVLLGVTGGARLSPTHTPQRRTRQQYAPRPEPETTTEETENRP